MSRQDLTPRERVAAELVAEGLTNPEIGAQFSSSVSTVQQNLANILIEWHCTTRTQVAVEATRRGVLRPSQLADRTPNPAIGAGEPRPGR